MKKNKGQALIEFVLILPILFVLFTFIFEVGMIINEKSEVESKVTDTIYLWKKQNRPINDLKDMLEANQITSTIQSDNSLASIKAYKKISFKGLLPVYYKIEVKRVIPIE